MIRRPPRSTLDRSSAASDVYKRQVLQGICEEDEKEIMKDLVSEIIQVLPEKFYSHLTLSLIHISEPTRPY